MTLTEDQKKLLNDLALGKIITGKMSVNDQIAAIREQVAAISAAMKVPLESDFQALEELVVAEKEKKEKKAEPAKKTAKKSK